MRKTARRPQVSAAAVDRLMEGIRMIHWMKIDTDPDANLILALTNFLQGIPPQRKKILSVTAIPTGYVILYQDVEGQ